MRTRAGASSRVDGARTLAFAASASFTIVFIFMDASAAIFLAATRPPRGSSVGEERGFISLRIVSEVETLFSARGPPPLDDDGTRSEGEPGPHYVGGRVRLFGVRS